MSQSRRVYSTEQGRICPRCDKPVKKCRCGPPRARTAQKTSGDGIVRLGREIKGRKGKGVTTISGLDLESRQLKDLAAELKKKCGCGGSIKNGIVIIQGDHRPLLAEELKRKGYKVKMSGG